MKKRYKIAIKCLHCGDPFDVDWDMPRRGSIRCDKCGASYPIVQGVLDLRGDMARKRKQGSQVWDLDAIDCTQERTGYYEDNWEYARVTGVPEVVERYRFPRIKGWILDNMRIEDDGLYLDVGCGVGMMFFRLKERHPDIDFRLVGIDVCAPRLISLARRKEREKAATILPIAGDGERLPFPSNAFDGIICSEVIEHILDKQRAVCEMARVLKPAGELFLTTPNRTAVNLWNTLFGLPRRVYRAMRGKGRQDPAERPFESPIDQGELRRLCSRARLRLIDVDQVSYLPHESYYQFMPKPVVKLVVRAGGVLEGPLNPAFKWLGLHMVAKCEKPGDPAG